MGKLFDIDFNTLIDYCNKVREAEEQAIKKSKINITISQLEVLLSLPEGLEEFTLKDTSFFLDEELYNKRIPHIIRSLCKKKLLSTRPNPKYKNYRSIISLTNKGEKHINILYPILKKQLPKIPGSPLESMAEDFGLSDLVFSEEQKAIEELGYRYKHLKNILQPLYNHKACTSPDLMRISNKKKETIYELSKEMHGYQLIDKDGSYWTINEVGKKVVEAVKDKLYTFLKSKNNVRLLKNIKLRLK